MYHPTASPTVLRPPNDVSKRAFGFFAFKTKTMKYSGPIGTPSISRNEWSLIRSLSANWTIGIHEPSKENLITSSNYDNSIKIKY
ncbi:unnamed protein product [Camellia sinensis]